METIESALVRRSLTYSIRQDLSYVQQQIEANNQVVTGHPTPSIHFAYLYVTLDLEALFALGDELKSFGIDRQHLQPAPDFESPEYLCLKCGHRQEQPGACPKHRRPLVSFEQYAHHKKFSLERKVSRFVLLLLVLLMAASWLWF